MCYYLNLECSYIICKMSNSCVFNNYSHWSYYSCKYLICLYNYFDTSETQTIPFDVCTRCRPTWSHKYLCSFTLSVYNMYFLCDHTTYCNNYTPAYQLPINSVSIYACFKKLVRHHLQSNRTPLIRLNV